MSTQRWIFFSASPAMCTHTARVRCVSINSLRLLPSRNACPQNTRSAPAQGLGSSPPAQPHYPTILYLYFIFLSLSFFVVAVVNLPFSESNKKLIGKKKKKSHFIPNNKRPIDFSIF